MPNVLLIGRKCNITVTMKKCESIGTVWGGNCWVSERVKSAV